MEVETVLQRGAIALGLGLLVGLQRELTKSGLAGIRTFPVITLFGALSALLSLQFGGWVIASATLAVASILIIGNLPLFCGNQPREESGVTTEFSALVMFAVGAYLIVGEIIIAVIVGALTAVLLQFKEPLHRVVSKIGDKDAYAIAQFVLISLVILPILPNRAYGPYSVFNPFQTWTVVVLIVGMGLAAYICQRMFGNKAGALLSGVLGGLISSTATTVSHARMSKQSPNSAVAAALVIVIASSIVFARMIAEILFVAPTQAAELVPPVAAMLVLMIAISAAVYFFAARTKMESVAPPSNPADLKAAIVFGIVYSAVLFAVAAAKDLFGDSGLYAVSVISGLTDVDALTLSTAQLVSQSRVDPITGSHLILIGALANLVFKSGIVFAIGDRRAAKLVAVAVAIAVVTGIAILFAWKPIADALAFIQCNDPSQLLSIQFGNQK